MLQIEENNLLIEKTLTERIFSDEGNKSIDRIVTDFDFTAYHISTPETKHQLLISIYLKCWDDLYEYGVIEYLSDKYTKYSSCLTILPTQQVEASYNYSMVLDLEKIKEESEEFKLEVIQNVSLLKRYAMASAFAKAFNRYDELSQQYMNSNTYAEEIQTELFNEPVLVVRYRGLDECIYIKPSFDRVTVIFSTVFQDETDKVFGKVFLQEFVDARKRSVQTAPQVLYNDKEPPLDIQSVAQGNKNNENKGYVTFVLFPRHLVKGDKRENCIGQIQVFRSYFHYHIKCSKAYMHSRMRFRVKEFLKILNRAKPENLDNDGKTIENRKTASGRRFDLRA